MEVGRYLVEAHLKEGRSVASLARDHGLHPSWIYKLLARYRAEGEAGLAPRSKRPHGSPTTLSHQLEERILSIRKELTDAGRRRSGDDPGPPRTRGGAPSVGELNLARVASPRVRHAPTPEASEILLPTI
jgi:transposase-like protein